jgi:2-polyprenyl-6-methoxyphenol hydroxylase-like FAD-dependent oxidoreductase
MFKTSFVGSCSNDVIKYETGKTVDDVTYDDKGLKVIYHDMEGHHKEVSADLVIAADGANSTVRRKLLPEIKPIYAGYVTWRGVVSEDQVKGETKTTLSNRIVLLRTEDGYIIS